MVLGKGRYGGITADFAGHIIATKSEKGKQCIEVYSYADGALLFSIDSYDSKLKRPSGVATSSDYHLYVIDLGNDCLKKYRYK